MNNKHWLLLLGGIVVVTAFFFYKIWYGQVPFPGDLLADTTPFKAQSYNGYAPGGYPNKAQGRDVIDQSLPWRYFTVSQIKKGHIPLWNPYNFSGNAHIGDFQTGVFYPLSIIFFLLPFPVAWTVFIILQPLLAIWFMYLFLRSLDRGQITSFLGGVAFGFCSYMVVWMEYGNIDHVLLWLPLLLFSVTKYFQTKRFGFIFLFIFSGAMCLLGGYIQGAFYVFATTFLYSLCILFKNKNAYQREFLLLLFSFIVMGCLAAVQIFPTLIIFVHSTRGNYTQSQIHNLLQPWYYLVTVFSSEFFGNPATRNFYLPITYFERVMYVSIPIVFFALYGLRAWKNFSVKFFAILAGITVIAITDLPGVSWLYSLPIPVLSTTVPTRLLSIFAFCTVVLGVYGIDLWWEEKKQHHLFPIVFGGLYLIFWIVILVLSKIHPELSPALSITKHTLLLSTLFALATIAVFYGKNINKYVSLGLLCIIIIADLFYVFAKFTPFAPATLLYPSTLVVSYLQQQGGLYRSWGYGNAYIPANYATQMGIYSADGYDALHNMDYNRLLNSSAKGKVLLPLSRGDANIAPGSGFAPVSDNIYRQKILNLLGVKYILHVPFSGDVAKAETGVFPESYYKLGWHDTSYQIYQNLQVFPRFFLANRFSVVTKKNDIENIYTTDLRKTILLYQTPEHSLTNGASGSVTVSSYSPNKIIFTTTTNGNELLFISDTYDSGWHAAIDGKSTKVYQADVAFRAVEVPKGKHTVVLFYQPFAFLVGWGIFLVTGGGLVVLSIFVFFKHRKV